MYNLPQIGEDLAALDNAQANELFTNPETGKPVAPPTLSKWRENVSMMPLWAIQKIARTSGDATPGNAPAATDPGFTQIDPSWSRLPEWERPKLVIGFPTSGHSTHTKTLFCLMALQWRHGKKIQFMPCENNPIGRARNIIATQFLANPGKPEWLLFIDNDMIVPFGSEPLAKAIWGSLGGAPFIAPGMDIISRLVSHGKQLVGGFYVGRAMANSGQFAECYENIGINRKVHCGPKNELLPTKWVATGMMLINRSVFLAIAEKFPEMKPRHPDDPYRFFAMEDDEGEDVLFCKRAREAGIQPYVDMGCVGGHEGNYIFWPHNTIGAPPKVGTFLSPQDLVLAESMTKNPEKVSGNGHVPMEIPAMPLPSAPAPNVPVESMPAPAGLVI